MALGYLNVKKKLNKRKLKVVDPKIKLDKRVFIQSGIFGLWIFFIYLGAMIGLHGIDWFTNISWILVTATIAATISFLGRLVSEIY
ncbi:hypothetical protein ACFLQ6_01535 [Thermoproteota archaeon]